MPRVTRYEKLKRKHSALKWLTKLKWIAGLPIFFSYFSCTIPPLNLSKRRKIKKKFPRLPRVWHLMAYGNPTGVWLEPGGLGALFLAFTTEKPKLKTHSARFARRTRTAAATAASQPKRGTTRSLNVSILMLFFFLSIFPALLPSQARQPRLNHFGFSSGCLVGLGTVSEQRKITS